MVSTQFKLTKPGGLTRRIQFPDLPSWFALASKIESLYDIPIEKVGVAYVDTDGDEVTLSSEDELQDFYAFSRPPSDTIKLAVQDLRSLRDSQHLSSKGGSETPRNVNYRDTFGGVGGIPMQYEVEDEWQRLPEGLKGLFGRTNSGGNGLYGSPDSPPEAFIEVLPSDTSSVHKDMGDTTMESDLLESFDASTIAKGKGKARAEMQPSVSDNMSSTGSVLVAEDHVKYPIHVLDVGNEGMAEPVLIDTSTAHPGVESSRSTVMPIQAESTPIIAQQSLSAEKGKLTDNKDSTTNKDVADDPPLPSLDFEQTQPPVSLTGDVATFLTSLSTVFSSHPELSEGIRNITRNAANGTYWLAHREAVSRAAEEFRRSATEEGSRTVEEVRRVAEEEAGKRVADALAGLMRLFGTAGDSTVEGSVTPTPNNGADASAQPTTVDYGDLNSNNSLPTLPRRPFPWGSGERFTPPPGAPPPPGPPPPSGAPPHGRRGPFGSHPPPPPPPPHFHGHHPFAPPLGPPHRAQWGSPFWARPPHQHAGGAGGAGRRPPPMFTPWGRTGPPPLSDAVGTWVGPSSGSIPSPEELRARVETAKQNYKREKEMYRQAREARKASEERQGNSREMTAQHGVVKTEQSPSVPVPPPVTQIVSNARGPYPELEMISVPRNHRRNISTTAADQEAQLTRRITRRVAEMGFTENAYPALPSRIKDLITVNKPLDKEGEDDIVTTLLEDLLAMPNLSGSDVRPDNNTHDGGSVVPGAWQ